MTCTRCDGWGCRWCHLPVPPIKRWHKVVLAAFALAMLASLCNGCSMTPLEPTDPVARVGYWHTDGAQVVCTEAFCYHVYADVEVAEDGSCDYTWNAQGMEPGAQWAMMEPVECYAEPGAGVVKVYSTAQVRASNVTYQQVLNFTLYARGPQADPFSSVQWRDLQLIRRTP